MVVHPAEMGVGQVATNSDGVSALTNSWRSTGTALSLSECDPIVAETGTRGQGKTGPGKAPGPSEINRQD